MKRGRSQHRAYRCLICGKLDRKGRLVAHLFKQHVSVDRIPFRCSICNFRCVSANELFHHLTGYQRHVEEIQKRGPVDLKSSLHKSPNPVNVETLMEIDETVMLDDDVSIDSEGTGLPDWLNDVAREQGAQQQRQLQTPQPATVHLLQGGQELPLSARTLGCSNQSATFGMSPASQTVVPTQHVQSLPVVTGTVPVATAPFLGLNTFAAPVSTISTWMPSVAAPSAFTVPAVPASSSYPIAQPVVTVASLRVPSPARSTFGVSTQRSVALSSLNLGSPILNMPVFNTTAPSSKAEDTIPAAKPRPAETITIYSSLPGDLNEIGTSPVGSTTAYEQHPSPREASVPREMHTPQPLCGHSMLDTPVQDEPEYLLRGLSEADFADPLFTEEEDIQKKTKSPGKDTNHTDGKALSADKKTKSPRKVVSPKKKARSTETHSRTPSSQRNDYEEEGRRQDHTLQIVNAINNVKDELKRAIRENTRELRAMLTALQTMASQQTAIKQSVDALKRESEYRRERNHRSGSRTANTTNNNKRQRPSQK